MATKGLEHNPRIAITVIRHPLITKAFYYTAHGMSREENAAFGFQQDKIAQKKPIKQPLVSRSDHLILSFFAAFLVRPSSG